MTERWLLQSKYLERVRLDDAFVMDLGRIGDTWKIVELNNINSAGLYETDTDAIVSALKHL